MFDAIDRRELERKIDCSRAAGAALHFVPIATLDRMLETLAEQDAQLAAIREEYEVLKMHFDTDAVFAEEQLAAARAEVTRLRGLVRSAYSLSEYAACSKLKNTREFLLGDERDGGLFGIIEGFQKQARAALEDKS